MRRTIPSSLLLLLVCAACGRSAADESPVATVRHFLEVMSRSADDESALREAYRLVGASARTALARRADRATALSGRAYEPWQMLSQGRFRLHFTPASRGGMRERVDGNHAVVTVTGEQPGQHADVSLVREQGHWRVELSIPPLRSDSSDPRQSDG